MNKSCLFTLGRHQFLMAIVAVLVLITSQPLSATLIGDMVTAHVQYGTTVIIDDSATVVDPGIEFVGPIVPPDTISIHSWTIDIFADNTFTLRISTGLGVLDVTSPVDWMLTDLDWLGLPSEIIGVNLIGTTQSTLLPTPPPNSFLSPGIAYGPDWITITQAPFFNPGLVADTATFEILTAQIPIPAALWLFGSGMLGLVGVARKKRK